MNLIGDRIPSVAIKYLLFFLVALPMSSGAVVAATLDCYDAGHAIGWLIFPLALMMLGAAVLNDRVLIPKFLLRRRYLIYALLLLAVSFVVPLLAIPMEYGAREAMEMPHRIADYLSPWIFVNNLSSAALIFLLLCGMSVAALYHQWQAEAAQERALSASVERQIRELKSRLDPKTIFGFLDRITAAVKSAPQTALEQIQKLSSYLRAQLYELPAPVLQPANDPDPSPGKRAFRIEDFISASRYRLWRFLAMELLIALICIGCFFVTPDSPVFNADMLESFLALMVVLNMVCLGNFYLLFPLVLKKGSLRGYVMWTTVFVIAVALIAVIAEYAFHEPTPYRRRLPAEIAFLAMSGTTMTLGFFLAGTASILSLKRWILSSQRKVRLQAEQAKYELAFLKKQINPHFLFNVLNNIGILVEEEPEDAARMLKELRILLDYQLTDTNREYTTVGAELNFISSYLALEKTRKDRFDYTVAADAGLDDVRIPTLLFIPFVENAAKYSSTVNGKRLVSVKLSRLGKHLMFECVNDFKPADAVSSEVGGLGIPNTLRRLELLYGQKFTYATQTTDSKYITRITLPII